MAPKLEIGKLVKKVVSAIAANDGGKKKNEIDSAKGYNELCNLISGNTITMNETEKEYLLGLKVQYERTYLGESNNNSGTKTSTSNTQPAENKTNTGKETGESKSKENEKPQGKNRPQKSKPVPPKGKSSPAPKFQSTTNNSGINNSFNGNSGTIIIDKSVHIGATEGSKSNPPASGSTESKPNSKVKQDTIRKNKENYTAAFAEGESVADDLIGPTSQKEKIRAIRNIMKQNENTIIGFMEGFYSNDTVAGIPNGIGDLLDLVDNEGAILFDAKWTDSERQRVFTKVMESTLKYAENTGNTENSSYKELAKLLKDVKAGKPINTETADAYIKELIASGSIDVNS